MCAYRIETTRITRGRASREAFEASDLEGAIGLAAAQLTDYMGKGIADRARAAEISARATFERAERYADTEPAGRTTASTTHGVRNNSIRVAVRVLPG